ncbi:MAG: hypothetical protein VX962_09445 [Pseudomonadota bacterium]|nr:hypothetical protein [Pseudomonadota bacterium]
MEPVDVANLELLLHRTKKPQPGAGWLLGLLDLSLTDPEGVAAH